MKKRLLDDWIKPAMLLVILGTIAACMFVFELAHAADIDYWHNRIVIIQASELPESEKDYRIKQILKYMKEAGK